MTETAVQLQRTLPPDIADFCRRAVEALRAKLPVREVWLFGSHAEGRAKPHSDVDLFAVLADDHGLTHPSRACEAAIAPIKTRRRVDVHTLPEGYWHHPRYRSFGLWSDVVHKGICLYESGEFFHHQAASVPIMPGDPTEPDSWFTKARRDLRGARTLLDSGDIENAVVLLEQSAEKLLKGWLIEQGWKLERTHLLGDLLAEIRTRGVVLDWFADDAAALSKGFLLMRYPNEELVPSESEVAEFIANIERLFTELGVTL